MKELKSVPFRIREVIVAKKGQKKTKSSNRRTNLESVLQSIYHDTVNLQTTCAHSCNCCKIAMPQLNYSEFVQIATVIWKEKSHDEILDIICNSLEYFFRYEYDKWGMDALVKPCMFLNADGMCSIYKNRPLSCILYGLWPEDVYEERVQKFVKAYETKYGLKREDIPLSTQCKLVKRVDDSIPLTKEVIEGLYEQLDKLDSKIGDFSAAQIRQKENYRTFHDWLLLKILDEDWLSQLTTFILAADKATMESQITILKEVIRDNFKAKLPNLINKL